MQIRNVWKNTSGWNVDRIPANKLKLNVVLLYGQVLKPIVSLLKRFILMPNMTNGGKNRLREFLMSLHNINTNTIFHNNLAKIFVQFEPITEDLTQLLQACYNPITSDIELEVRMKLLDELFAYAKTEDDLLALFALMITDRVYEYPPRQPNRRNRLLPRTEPRQSRHPHRLWHIPRR
jgi:hypothetical protein